MKKIVIRIAMVMMVIGVLITGKMYLDSYQNKSIAQSKEAKTAIEKMLKGLDEKALTPEGKIKSYKIDDNYTHKNPMGGVSVKIVINEDESLYLGTILNKYSSSKEYNLGVLSFSPEVRKLIYR
ncbi:DUF1310 family protein [Gemella morbillorum]|uniref:DUF1310 family protein n=1 Tax=Gemella morbillorum TaxID=29391 RepID=UPI0028D7C26A|nr:DUF1310 family protein [Gemella morbillorum]